LNRLLPLSGGFFISKYPFEINVFLATQVTLQDGSYDFFIIPSTRQIVKPLGSLTFFGLSGEKFRDTIR